jgi:hypothetical protein
MIIAYASGQANPISTRTNAQIDLQNGDTLPASQQVFGDAVDTENGGANFTFSWTLLRNPEGSSAALNSSTAQDPTLGTIDIFGNYRLFLIATNTSTNETSETDPLLAPNSAFTTVEVLSSRLGIQKPASGERDWNVKAYEWVDALETIDQQVEDVELITVDHEGRIVALEGLSTSFSVDDLSDTNIGTLAPNDVLTWSGSEWQNISGDKGLDDLTDVTLGTLTSGEVVKFTGSGFVNEAVELNELSDVNLGTLSAGQSLVYDEPNDQWINSTPVSDLGDLGDVTLGTLTSGEALIWSGSEWANSEVSTTLSIMDEYGIEQDTVNLLDEGIAFSSDDFSIDVTLGTITGNLGTKVDLAVAPNQNLGIVTMTGSLTLNEDNDVNNDPIVFFKRGDVVLPAIQYNITDETFELKRNNSDGFEEIATKQDAPTTTERGLVRRASEFDQYNSVGKIVNVERLMYTASVDGMVDYKSDSQNNKSGDGNVEIAAFDSNNVAQHPALVFHNNTGSAIALTNISCIMASSGISSTTEYAFNLVSYTSLGNAAADTRQQDYGLPTYNRIGDNEMGMTTWNYVSHNASVPLEIGSGHIFGISVEDSPDHAGNRLQVTIEAIKLIN